jgi:iron complex transport system substrate-binding protein
MTAIGIEFAMNKLKVKSPKVRKSLFLFCTLVFWCLNALIGYANQNYPQRIISLGPSITEELYLLGVEDRLIGCTVYCKKPKEAESKEKIGTVVEVNIEKIVSLKPDLVLATSLSDPKVIEKLRRLGIKVISFSSPENFPQICEQFLELGKITGREKVAEELVEQAKQKVENIKKKVNDLPKPKVFIQVGAKPLFTVTGDSFVNDFIEFAGGVNIAQNLNMGLYSREKVLKNNPDVIIIVTMGIVGEHEKKIWQKYRTLKAVKNNRIFIMDSYKLCSPTPVSFVDTLEKMVKILHPEKEKEIWRKYKTLEAVKYNRIYIVDSYKLCSPTPVSFIDTLEEMVKILHPEKRNR